jgi:hypothetical protein
MGEAKRRAAAQPETLSNRMLCEVDRALAALPPAPMRGAVSLDLSPGDHRAVMEHAEAVVVDLRGGIMFDGIGLRTNPLLVDGLMLGRNRDGTIVWSNQAWMQEAIDGGFASMS